MKFLILTNNTNHSFKVIIELLIENIQDVNHIICYWCVYA